jgi:hypothetical protein
MAVAAISSVENVVQGGPALVQINRLGQTNMEISYYTNHAMTIEKDALLGITEKLGQDDQLGELRVNKMTVNLKQKEPHFQDHRRKEEIYFGQCQIHQEDVADTVRQKYITLLLKHHEIVSDSLFDTGQPPMILNTKTKCCS